MLRLGFSHNLKKKTEQFNQNRCDEFQELKKVYTISDTCVSVRFQKFRGLLKSLWPSLGLKLAHWELNVLSKLFWAEIKSL